jgi:hypothetical protein
VAFNVPDPYREAIRGGLAVTYFVDATLDGDPVPGATRLAPVGGTVTDTTRPGVRRVLNLELAPEPGMFDRLAPIGTTLSVTARVQYTNRTAVDIPMGVFDVDSESLSEGGGGLRLTAPDRWVKIQRARFIRPQASTRGARITDQIVSLIRGALGPSEPVVVTARSTATVGALVWEKDRDQAIIDLATQIGAWVYFDRQGVATVASVPGIGASASWLVDASASGVLVELDRERSRTKTRNVVIVESSHAAGAKFPMQCTWDGDVTSPTYAGTNPLTNPGSAGPFGIVPYYFDSPVLTSPLAALHAARTILSRTTGLASQVSLGQVPNPAVDAFDTLDVMPPRERYDIPRVLERHVADTVTHPLTLGSPQQIEGRSTRSDIYAESA